MPSRYSPGVQPVSPLEVFSQAGHAFLDERERLRERERQEEEDRRRREREDLQGDLTRLEIEALMRDEFGGVPVDRAAAGSAFQEARGRYSARNNPPVPGTDIFEGERPGLAATSDRRSPLERGEVAVLPGQFAGGQFQPTAVPAPTRTVGGRTFRVDPTQTADARARAREQEEFDRTVADLVAAGHDPMDARALARGFQPAEDEPQGFDPDRPGTFATQEEYLAFQEALADARARAGGGRGGGTPRADFTAEDLRAAGVPEEFIPALLEDPLLARQVLAGMARNPLFGTDLDELMGAAHESGPITRNQPGFRNWLARVLPGGRGGRDEFDVDAMLGVIEGLSDAEARAFLRSERFGSDEIERILAARGQAGEVDPGR